MNEENNIMIDGVPMQGEPEPFITPDDVAARWRCSDAHVRRLTKDGLIPHYRFGGRGIRYKMSDIIEVEALLFKPSKALVRTPAKIYGLRR